MVIGLVGGVSAGKSAVARLFGELGCLVADADRMCHDALDEPDIRRRVVVRFGAEVLSPDGVIDRSRLRRVFEDEEDLRRLESILHPVVQERTEQLIRVARETHAPGVVIDAPLLLESGLDRLCDVVVIVEAVIPFPTARSLVTVIPSMVKSVALSSSSFAGVTASLARSAV